MGTLGMGGTGLRGVSVASAARGHSPRTRTCSPGEVGGCSPSTGLPGVSLDPPLVPPKLK